MMRGPIPACGLLLSRQFSWHTATLILVSALCGCFHAFAAELRSCSRSWTVPKAHDIYQTLTTRFTNFAGKVCRPLVQTPLVQFNSSAREFPLCVKHTAGHCARLCGGRETNQKWSLPVAAQVSGGERWQGHMQILCQSVSAGRATCSWEPADWVLGFPHILPMLF